MRQCPSESALCSNGNVVFQEFVGITAFGLLIARRRIPALHEPIAWKLQRHFLEHLEPFPCDEAAFLRGWSLLVLCGKAIASHLNFEIIQRALGIESRVQ